MFLFATLILQLLIQKILRDYVFVARLIRFGIGYDDKKAVSNDGNKKNKIWKFSKAAKKFINNVATKKE